MTAAALGRRRGALAYIGLAVVAYVPALLSSPGDVSADTKQYLYLDPGGLLRRAAYLWDPAYGAGTVTHQSIGFLFPMGPFYWAFDAVGVPDWFAQRLWWGSLLFGAAVGVMFLLRTLSVRGTGAVVAALVYMLSPYTLAFTARISAILLPWVGLPWLVALAVRSVRRGGWRDPAMFALVVLLVGGTNATSLAFVALGPALWLVHEVVVVREVRWQAALAAAGRIVVLSLAVSLWWVGGLWVQRGYGLPVLRFTETIDAVASASSATELIRGLGNWFFYGDDVVGPWIEESVDYTQGVGLILVSFALPLLALVAAACTRWRHRAFFVALVLVGMVVAIGAYPIDDPSAIGAVFKWFTGSTAGLALRNTPRALPLVALGTAVLLGTGVSALARFRPRAGVLTAAGVGLLAIVNMTPVLAADYVEPHLNRPEEIPDYWTQAADALDAEGSDTRVLELPGADFGAYRWGNTVDPLLPGLIERPWVGRELLPAGAPATVNLVSALDRRLQEGVLEPASVAPIARFLSSGTVLLNADLEYERFGSPPPQELWSLFTDPVPPGLEEPETFGDPLPNEAVVVPSGLEEQQLAIPADDPEPPPLSRFGVEDPVAIVRTASTQQPVLVAGDGDGLVDAAGAGVLDGREFVVYSGSLTGDPDAIDQALADDADLLLTDTNRKRARYWGSLSEDTGYTEQVDADALLVTDRADQRLDLFPDADADSQSVAVIRGAESVSATTYGQPGRLFPEDRPVNAFDGDVESAWRAGRHDDVDGERIQIELDDPVTTDHVTLVQPVNGDRDRFITQGTLRFDGGDEVAVTLDDTSRGPEGQVVTFDEREFQTLEIEVDATNAGTRASYRGLSPVGFAEVEIDGVTVEEFVRLPVDLLDEVGDAADDHRLVVTLTRHRADPGDPDRADEEPDMARIVEMPDARDFTISGTGRVSAAASDPEVDAALGTETPGVVAYSSGRLAGDLGARASRAFDHDAQTAWTAAFGEQREQWIEIERDVPMTTDVLDLVVVADGRHSVPTRLRIENRAGAVRSVAVDPITDGTEPGTTAETTVPLGEAISGRNLRVVVEDVRPPSSGSASASVAIAEAGLPGPPTAALPAVVPATCRGLVQVNDEAVSMRLEGSATAAQDGQGLALTPCADSVVTLDGGDNVIESRSGKITGVDADQLVLSSAVGGRPRAGVALGPKDPSGPPVEITGSGRTSYNLTVESADEPFWLVLGQSQSSGWEANVSGGSAASGSELVDGYANGWLIEPDGTGPIQIELRWTPQRVVWIGLALSAIGILVCFALALWPRRRADAVVTFDDVAPALASPFVARGSRPTRVVVGVAGAVVAIVAALVASPLVGTVVGGASVWVLADRRARPLLTVGSVVALGVAALYVIANQLTDAYPAVPEWPTLFDRVHLIALTAVLLLAADAVVDVLRTRPAREGD